MALVLLVEDDPLGRKALAFVLRHGEHEVLTAQDGAEGLHLFVERRPAVAVVDLLMPVMEGIETIIKMRRANPAAKIIAMTGMLEQGVDYLAMAKQLGADRTLRKPFEAEALLDAVAALVAGDAG
jgi:hypothetical protein